MPDTSHTRCLLSALTRHALLLCSTGGYHSSSTTLPPPPTFSTCAPGACAAALAAGLRSTCAAPRGRGEALPLFAARRPDAPCRMQIWDGKYGPGAENPRIIRPKRRRRKYGAHMGAGRDVAHRDVSCRRTLKHSTSAYHGSQRRAWAASNMPLSSVVVCGDWRVAWHPR